MVAPFLSWFVVDERKTWEFLDVVKVMMAYVVAIVVVVGNEREGKEKRNGREKEGGKERSREELFVTEAVALVL
jgi:hypothetical protein